ncbi:MAG: hypothetical protein HQK59_06560 [Deltaproteobacteria bacterium]|nr:hypothetical protein [Deltaproteobacteria bacterium]
MAAQAVQSVRPVGLDRGEVGVEDHLDPPGFPSLLPKEVVEEDEEGKKEERVVQPHTAVGWTAESSANFHDYASAIPIPGGPYIPGRGWR